MGAQQTIVSPNDTPTFEEECLEYQKRYFTSENSQLYFYEMLSGSKSFDIIDVKGVTDFKISKIAFQNTYLIIVHYSQNRKLYFRYYDQCLNLLKQAQYKYNKKSDIIQDVCMISIDTFVCRRNESLVITNIQNKTSRVLFDDSFWNSGWDFQVDDNNDIVLGSDLKVGENNVDFKIFSFESNYEKHTASIQTVFFAENNHKFYKYILPRKLHIFYGRSDRYIMNVYYEKKDNTYYVISNRDHSPLNIDVDEWHCKDSTWHKKAVIINLKTINILHYIASMLNKEITRLKFRNNHFCSVLLENPQQWRSRMMLFMSQISAISKFSTDIILLFLSYV